MNKALGLRYLLLLWAVSTGLFGLKIWQQGGAGVAALVPAWLFWMSVVPLVWLLCRHFPLSGVKGLLSLLVHVLVSCLVLVLFSLFVIFFEQRQPSSGWVEQLQRQLLPVIQQQAVYSLFMYWTNAALGYLCILLTSGKKARAPKETYENSILIKTNFGYVLVEIESFQYVRGGDRKIMFHTGRSTPLNRQRVRIVDGSLVAENRYQAERRIVIDLAKIRRAVKRGEQEHVFFIGFSHEVKLNAEMYRKLGGWLPRPVVESND